MQDNLPPLPEMKPIETPQAAEPVERPAPRGPSGTQSAMPPISSLARRLRQLLGMLAGGGLLMVTGVGALEVIAKPEYRPSTLIATFEGRTELGILNQKLGSEPGKMVLTEADYREQLANAERKGQASAELSFQKQLAVVQADKERVVAAYTTLYQRANMIAQMALQLEMVAQQFRQQLLQMSNGGKSMVIMFKDVFCGLGDAQSCESAHQDRRMMIDEADELSRGDVGAKVRELMSGIDDPATLVAHNDQQQNGTPALDRGQQRDPTFGMNASPDLP